MSATKDRPVKVRGDRIADLARQVTGTTVRTRVELPAELPNLPKDDVLVVILSGKKGELLRWRHSPAPSQILDDLDVDLLSRVIRHVFDTCRSLAEPTSAALSKEEKRLLRKGGFDPDAPVSTAPIEQAAAAYAALLASSLTVEEAAKRLGYSDASRVRQRLTSTPATLYGVKLGSEWRLPAFQFDKNGLVPGLERVIPALDPALGPVAVELWLTSPHVDLIEEDEETQVSPLDWLRTGRRVNVVVELASEL